MILVTQTDCFLVTERQCLLKCLQRWNKKTVGVSDIQRWNKRKTIGVLEMLRKDCASGGHC